MKYHLYNIFCRKVWSFVILGALLPVFFPARVESQIKFYPIVAQRFGMYRNGLPVQVPVPLLRSDRLVRGRRHQLSAHFGPVDVGARELHFIRMIIDVKEFRITLSDEFSEFVLVSFAGLKKKKIYIMLIRPNAVRTAPTLSTHNNLVSLVSKKKKKKMFTCLEKFYLVFCF